MNMDNTAIGNLLEEYFRQHEIYVLQTIVKFIKSKDFDVSATDTQLIAQMQDLLQQKSKNPGKKKGSKRTNGYILWCKEVGRPLLTGKDMTFGDKTRELSRMWKALPEDQKSEWKNKAKNIGKTDEKPKEQLVAGRSQQEEQAIERSRQELRRIKDEWNSDENADSADIADLVQQALNGKLSSSDDSDSDDDA